jgi:ABC-2 type transport system ATP-binding protein
MQSQNHDTAISIKKVSVSYDGAPAVQAVDLDVRAGEFFGLIGLNGAGKTTLIKSLLGLRRVEQGEMQIFGLNITDQKARRRLAFLPERFEPSWFLSGMEFLKFSARLYNAKLSNAMCEEAAHDLALDPAALRRRVQTYSKGMRQKLGLMATVLTGCDLLILDEPMSGLDPSARALTKNFLGRARAKGATIFMSSHILADMDEACERIAILHDRTILFTGTPSNFKSSMAETNLERSFLHFIEKRSVA